MRSMGKSRRIAVVSVLLCVVSGGAWALSAQAFASGSVRAAASTIPTPPQPTLKVHVATAAPNTTATNAHCGQTITASLTLNGDLYCPGSSGGLGVSGASVILNLNGHTISSDGNTYSTCIAVYGTSDTVENGHISNCESGVQVGGSKNTVTKLTMSDNSFGLVDAGGSNKVTLNTIVDNPGAGILSYGFGGTFTSNRIANNAWGFIDYASGITVTSNSIDSNSLNGILIDVSGEPAGTFTSNSVNYNGDEGVQRDSGTGSATDGGGNTAHGNGYANSTMEQCNGIACS